LPIFFLFFGKIFIKRAWIYHALFWLLYIKIIVILFYLIKN